jgi:hypothetical protein
MIPALVSPKPTVELPGRRTMSDVGHDLGVLLAPQLTHFVRNGEVVRVCDDRTLRLVKPVELASDIEHVAQLVKSSANGQQPTVCSTATAAGILGAKAFRDALPPLNLVSLCPVLLERHGQLVAVTGYDRESGILAFGSLPQTRMSPDDACRLLFDVVGDFRFATPADRSRAIAALITPALVMGGLLQGRAPIDLGEADSSQTGKGYRNKITAAVYGCTPKAVTTKRSGVASLEEAIDAALVAGSQFIALDNIRGRIDSPAIESLCTEDSYNARPAYQPNTTIDPRRVLFQFTSNQADFTKDFANRTSCVRLLKQPIAYQFASYPEGDVLTHVRANQPLYLSAVFTVISLWHQAGKPRTGDTRHDFRDWAQTLDWIVQHVLKAAPLLDGHAEAQLRMSNPTTNWLRDVALAVVRGGHSFAELSASALLTILETDGSVELLGDFDLSDGKGRDSALQQMGRRFKTAFAHAPTNTLQVDHVRITRSTSNGGNGKEQHRYLFAQLGGNGAEAFAA